MSRLSKFSRGRFFNGLSGMITVANAASLNFKNSSFTVVGWAKILDHTYPLTTFAVRKGLGCYFGPGRPGWVPGWETGHGYQAKGLHVCIRVITFDNGYQPPQMLGKWVHYAVVFDRDQQKKVFVYVNGKRQSNSLDISAVQGSVDNSRPLEFGQLYGWKIKGTLDEYRLYNKVLDKFEVAASLSTKTTSRNVTELKKLRFCQPPTQTFLRISYISAREIYRERLIALLN